MNGLNTSFNLAIPDFGTAMSAGKGFNASRFLGSGGGASSTGMDPFTIAMAGIGGIGQIFGGILGNMFDHIFDHDKDQDQNQDDDQDQDQDQDHNQDQDQESGRK